MRVRCSKGTYVRTLCHDLGQALGCGGCMSSLRRTEAAGFTLDEAVPLETVVEAAQRGEAEGLLLRVDEYFARNGWNSAVKVSPQVEKRLRNGAAVHIPGVDGSFRVYGESGEFLGLGGTKDGTLRLVKSFYEV